MEKDKYRNPNWRNLHDIKPDDQDIFAYDSDGNLVQKKVSFKSGSQPEISWGPINPTGEVIFCQAPSRALLEAISNHNDDPRTAFSAGSVRRQFGGHPDSRIADRRE